MGPPGCRTKEKAQALAGQFSYTVVTVGELLDKEVAAGSDLGKLAQQARSTFSLRLSPCFHHYIVPDKAVIALVNTKLDTLEKEGQSYILEGYPYTRVQAIALQARGVVPDKFFVLSPRGDDCEKKVTELVRSRAGKPGDDTVLARRILAEYSM